MSKLQLVGMGSSSWKVVVWQNSPAFQLLFSSAVSRGRSTAWKAKGYGSLELEGE